jgi:Serine-pyruvate aminotransferase/archaeal aspartate aminotransferase
LGEDLWTGDAILMIPGPTELHPRVRKVLSERSLPHYGPEWAVEVERARELAAALFGSRPENTFLIPGPGSLALELGSRTVLSRGKKAIVLNSGFWGERLSELARSLGAKVVEVRADEGNVPELEEVEEALRKNPDAEALMLVHVDTGPGVMHDLKSYVKLAKEKGLRVICDAIASYGAVPLMVRELGIDVCVGHPNKCLNSMPGVAPLYISPDLWDGIDPSEIGGGWISNPSAFKRYYLLWSEEGHPYHTTINPYAVMAFALAAESALEEGLEKRYRRHVEASRAFRRAASVLGLKQVAASEEVASPTVTSLKLPDELSGRADEFVHHMLKKYRVMVTNGLGNLVDSAIRVGHMGITATARYLIPTIVALGRTLEDLTGRKVEIGRAVEAFLESSTKLTS